MQDVDLSKKINTSIQQATPSKRKTPLDGDEDAEGDSDNDENEEGYNTRYKGIKRVKVHGPTPEPPGLRPRRRLSRPRKSVPVEGEVRKRGRPRKNVSSAGEAIKVSKGKGRPLENGETVEDVVVVSSISRPRGRPRKNENGVPRRGPVKKPRRQSTNANHVPLSKDSGREVFDGILLVKRQNGKERVVGDGQEDDNAGDNDGEVPPAGNNDEGNGSEEDAVLAAVNGDDAQGDLSSLGGSNKGNKQKKSFFCGIISNLCTENEISATYTPDPEEGKLNYEKSLAIPLPFPSFFFAIDLNYQGTMKLIWTRTANLRQTQTRKSSSFGPSFSDSFVPIKP